jgi:ribonuclease Z
VLDEAGLRITAFKVTHDPVKPAYGYRFDYGGREGRSPARCENHARHPVVPHVARGSG